MSWSCRVLFFSVTLVDQFVALCQKPWLGVDDIFYDLCNTLLHIHAKLEDGTLFNDRQAASIRKFFAKSVWARINHNWSSSAFPDTRLRLYLSLLPKVSLALEIKWHRYVHFQDTEPLEGLHIFLVHAAIVYSKQISTIDEGKEGRAVCVPLWAFLSADPSPHLLFFCCSYVLWSCGDVCHVSCTVARLRWSRLNWDTVSVNHRWPGGLQLHLVSCSWH